MSEIPSANFHFGVFALSKNTGELRKSGVPIRLTPQPAQVLLLLVERAGEIVTRKEIQAVAWSSDTVVDFELGLNRCIGRIRSALLDNADSPRYIETIPRVGYRFIAPVKMLETAAVGAPDVQDAAPARPDFQAAQASTDSVDPVEPLSGAGHPKPHEKDRRKKVIVMVVATFLLVFGAGAGLWSVFRHRGTIGSNLNLVPLANELGSAYSPAFSPDGRQIAFVWNGRKQDNFDIYVKLVASQEVVKLTSSPEMDYSPAWSPDGRFIAFCRGNDQTGGAIWLISPLGGAERKVVDVHTNVAPDLRSLTWTPDGRWLAYPDFSRAEGTQVLFVVNVESGEKRQLTFPLANAVDMFPVFSPDGRTLAFTRDTGRGVSQIHLLPFRADNTGPATPVKLSWVGFERVSCSRPAWTPDSKEIVFASNRTGEHQLWAVAADASAHPRLLDSLGTNVMDAAISSNGKLALARTTFDANIWEVDVSLLRNAMPATPVQVAASTRIESDPKVSPDGLKIAFESNRAGFMEIWAANVDGSNLSPLTDMRSPITGSPAWSPDGGRIAFDSRAEGGPRIYVVPSVGGKPVAVTSSSIAGVIPSWSPDGEWIYFTSRSSDRSEIWRIPSRGGTAERLTLNGGFAALPSADGDFLYYTGNRNSTTSLRRLNLATRAEETIASGVMPRGYFPTNDGLYYIAGGSYEPQSLRFWKTGSGTSQLLLKFEKPITEGVGLSPDGREFYYGQIDYSGSDLTLVENFWR